MLSSSGRRFLSAAEKIKKPKTVMEADWNLISYLYRDAPHKREQIKILGHLYLKSDEEVAQYLFDHGFNDKYIASLLKKK